jgi:diguanylate cyclase (GGDEF)-like protein
MTQAEGTPSRAELYRRVEALERENRELRERLERERVRADRMEELADRDPLTGLLNRRAFARELGLMLAFARRYGTTGAVIYFDVNNLKRINDTRGHAAGDSVLVHVAGTLPALVRESDVVGRLGGDEFAVLLQQTDRATAERKARELVDSVEARPLHLNGCAIPVRLAYGAYAFDGAETGEQAIETADQRMYDQKRQAKG